MNIPLRPSPIDLALVNDYEIIVHGLKRMLDPYNDRVRVVDLEAGTLPSVAVDIALFDTFAGRRFALERIKEMTRDGKIGKVVLYTWDAPIEFLNDVNSFPVDGVILKTQTGEALVDSLVRIHNGERLGIDHHEDAVETASLSEREQEVLALLAMGSTNREIAAELYLSVDTVKTHLRRLFQKLEVKNRTQAALAAARLQVAPPPSRVRKRQ